MILLNQDPKGPKPEIVRLHSNTPCFTHFPWILILIPVNSNLPRPYNLIFLNLPSAKQETLAWSGTLQTCAKPWSYNCLWCFRREENSSGYGEGSFCRLRSEFQIRWEILKLGRAFEFLLVGLSGVVFCRCLKDLQLTMVSGLEFRVSRL